MGNLTNEFMLPSPNCKFYIGHTPNWKIKILKKFVIYILAILRLKISNNTLRPIQNGRHLQYDIFKCTFMNENVWISTKISLKFVPSGPINNIPALAQIMAWHGPGNKPLSELLMVSLQTHLCVARPQWVKFLVQENQAGGVVKACHRFIISILTLALELLSSSLNFSEDTPAEICQSKPAPPWPQR